MVAILFWPQYDNWDHRWIIAYKFSHYLVYAKRYEVYHNDTNIQTYPKPLSIHNGNIPTQSLGVKAVPYTTF